MTERAAKMIRLAEIGHDIDDIVRREYTRRKCVAATARALGLERSSVRAAIAGWASVQSRLEAARRRRA